nr:DUF6701 domain-containing protein [uncultured Duganella sp.]
MWLNLLTMLRRGCWAAAAALLAWSGNAAADINFNGSTPVPATCSLNGNTYTCASVTPVIWNDSIIIANGYTVIVNGPFSPGYNTGFTMSGTAALQTTGNNAISLSNIDPTKVLISGGTITAGGSFTPVSAGKTITANISAASISASNVTINGTLKASTTISLTDKVTVNGPITAGALTTSGDYTNINGDVSVTGAINFGSNTTVKGVVGAGSITTNSSVTLSKSLTVTGTADLGSAIKIGGDVTANSVKTGSPAQISGLIDSKTTVDLGSGTTVGGSIKGTTVTSGSPVTLNGAVTATTSFYLGSGSSVTGNITSPTVTFASSGSTIKGDIKVSGKLDMGSTVKVTGIVSAGSAILRAEGASINGNTTIDGTLELQSGTTVSGTVKAGDTTMGSSARIDGNTTLSGKLDMGSSAKITGTVSATGLTAGSSASIVGNTTISGDVLLQSSSGIYGDLIARDVKTVNPNGNIYGNATVNSIFIDGSTKVEGCITCIGAPSTDPHRCVSKPSWYAYTPNKCVDSGSTSIHHFQISHSGIGLTCEAQPVVIKACTDANCTGTATNPVTVTLSPGGGAVEVNGPTNAQVRNATATGPGGVTLSATVDGVTNPNVCPNAATGTNNCQMVFQDAGLVMTVPDHVSLAPSIKLSLKALQTSPQGKCVSLVPNDTPIPIQFSCNYLNPQSGQANPVGVTVDSKNFSCGGGTTEIKLTFKDGVATPSPPLQYSEVGQVSLSAAYTGNGLGASGAAQFTTAPASIKIEPVRVSSADRFSATAFAKASEPFTVKLTALNTAGNIVQNFGRENLPNRQNFMIPAPQLIAPQNGDASRLTIGKNKGIAAGVAFPADGIDAQWHFDDTGTLRITATIENNVGYLGNATAGFKTSSDIDLVFVPDHFKVALVAGAPMDCAKTGLSNPCDSSNASGKFIYSMQPFNLEVSAYTGTKNPDNSNEYLPPRNYTGTAARAIVLSAWNAAAPNVAVPITVGAFNWNKPQPSAVPFSFNYTFDTDSATQKRKDEKTTGTLNTALSALPSFDFAARPTAPTTISVRATDSDGASSAGFDATLTVVSGQLEIANISGPLTGTVPVTAKAQYWNGKAYVFNPRFAFDDPSQTLIASQALTVPLSRTDAGVKTYFLSYTNCKNGLYSGTANAPCSASAMPKPNSDNITFKNGVGTLRLNQPTTTPAMTRNGSVDITLKNGNDDLIKYLPSGTGTVIFGVYRSGPIIYMREVYN